MSFDDLQHPEDWSMEDCRAYLQNWISFLQNHSHPPRTCLLEIPRLKLILHVISKKTLVDTAFAVQTLDAFQSNLVDKSYKLDFIIALEELVASL